MAVINHFISTSLNNKFAEDTSAVVLITDWWVSLQEGSGAVGVLVQTQPPVAEWDGGLWLSDSVVSTTESAKFLGYHHIQRPEVGGEHSLHNKKDKTEDVVPAPAKEIQPPPTCDDPVLHSDYGVHPHLINNHLVRIINITRVSQTPAHSQDSRADHQL